CFAARPTERAERPRGSQGIRCEAECRVSQRDDEERGSAKPTTQTHADTPRYHGSHRIHTTVGAPIETRKSRASHDALEILRDGDHGQKFSSDRTKTRCTV